MTDPRPIRPSSAIAQVLAGLEEPDPAWAAEDGLQTSFEQRAE